MGNRILSPFNGWKHDELNLAVSEAIYSAFSPLVNKKQMHYMNFTSASGIFEDEEGFSVNLEFNVSEGEEVEIEYLNLLSYSFPDDKSSFMLETMLQIEQEFNLN